MVVYRRERITSRYIKVPRMEEATSDLKNNSPKYTPIEILSKIITCYRKTPCQATGIPHSNFVELYNDIL